YVMNTIGAILGSFAAGFVLLPAIGMEKTLLVVIVVASALAFGSVLAEPGRGMPRVLGASAALAVILAVALLGPRWNRGLLGAGVYFEPQQFIDANGKPA